MDAKQVYRLPPCPAYEMAATQFWLERLAQKGLRLARFTAGVGVFVQGAPATFRYRLDAYAASENPSDDGPAKQAVTLAEEFGWEYVCRRGQFAVYRTDDPAAPELHTDRELQALSLQALEKQGRRAMFWGIFWFFVNIQIHLTTSFVWLAAHCGLWFALWEKLLLVALFLPHAYQCWFLSRLRKQIREKGLPPPPSDLSRRAKRYHGSRLALVLAFVGLFAVMGIRDRMGLFDGADRRMPLEEYPGQPPFATVADIAPSDLTLTPRKASALDYNTYARWRHWPALTAIDWREYQKAALPSGKEVYFWLDVTYYQLPWAWMAKLLAGELAVRARVNSSFFADRLELPPLSTDDAWGYAWIPDILILREDDRVLYVGLHTNSDLDLADWARIFAESLK